MEQGVIIEIIFAVGQIVIAALISVVGKFPIVCKCHKWNQNIFFLLNQKKISKIFTISSHAVFILITCGSGGFLCMLIDIPIVQIYAMSVLMSSGLALNVVNSVAVESYPTAFR